MLTPSLIFLGFGIRFEGPKILTLLLLSPSIHPDCQIYASTSLRIVQNNVHVFKIKKKLFGILRHLHPKIIYSMYRHTTKFISLKTMNKRKFESIFFFAVIKTKFVNITKLMDYNGYVIVVLFYIFIKIYIIFIFQNISSCHCYVL
jgi:hypothetical protein